MKATLQRDRLRSVLRLCSEIARSDDALLLRTACGFLQAGLLSASGRATASVPAEDVVDGETCLPLRRLRDFALAAPDPAIRIMRDEGVCRLSSGGLRVSLACQPAAWADAMFRPQTPDGVARFALPARALMAAARAVEAACPTGDMTNRSGILLETMADRVVFVATDGRRLAMCEMDAKMSGAARVTLSPALGAALGALNAMLPDAMVETVATDEWAQFSHSAATLWFPHLGTGPYPNYRPILAEPSGLEPVRALVPGGDLASALRRAAIFTEDQALKVDVRGKTLHLSSVSKAGESRDAIPFPVESGMGTTAHFVPRFLLDGVERAPGESVRVTIFDDRTPARIEAPGYLYICMPVRMS